MKGKYILIGMIIAVLLLTVFVIRTKGFVGGIPCSKLPTVAEAERIVKEHRDIVDKIKGVRDNDSIDVIVDSCACKKKKCPGKADILIIYSLKEDGLKIKQIINSGTFFGIPYRLRNYGFPFG